MRYVPQSTLNELGFIPERDRPIVEGIRRLRGRMTRNQLCKEFNISYDKLVRIIKQYELQYKEYTRQRYNDEYDRYLAKRQLTNEIANVAEPLPQQRPKQKCCLICGRTFPIYPQGLVRTACTDTCVRKLKKLSIPSSSPLYKSGDLQW